MLVVLVVVLVVSLVCMCLSFFCGFLCMLFLLSFILVRKWLGMLIMVFWFFLCWCSVDMVRVWWVWVMLMYISCCFFCSVLVVIFCFLCLKGSRFLLMLVSIICGYLRFLEVCSVVRVIWFCFFLCLVSDRMMEMVWVMFSMFCLGLVKLMLFFLLCWLL